MRASHRKYITLERVDVMPDDIDDIDAKRAAKYEHNEELAERLNDERRDREAEEAVS